LVGATQHKEILMKLPRIGTQHVWRRTLATSFMVMAVAGCAGTRDSKLASVALTGTQHIGPDFNISSFYVDGNYGSNVGREGGGGSTICCVDIPREWRPGLTVEVRWVVGDWSKENLAETAVGNYRSLKAEGIYKAAVPVEKYAKAEHMYVHFFAGGKVRVVSTSFYPEGKNHPILWNDARASDSATVGTRVDALFTKTELAELQRQNEAIRKKKGDWR
jgi:hypothetical protein